MPSLLRVARPSGAKFGRLPVALSLLGVAFPLQATADNVTNQAAIPYSSPSIGLESHPEMDVLRDRFMQEIGTSDNIVFDRLLGPSSQLSWTRRQNNLGYASVERLNAAGLSMVEKIGIDSLRTAAI